VVVRVEELGRLCRDAGGPPARRSPPDGLDVDYPLRVNWFRRDAEGKFYWPGYGENVRILKWIVERIRGTAGAVETPIGYVPAPGSVGLDGLVSPARFQAALHVDNNEWLQALDDLSKFYDQFGARLPAPIRDANTQTITRLKRSA